MSAYFELGSWIWIVWNYILFKMSFGWVIFDKVWESYAWSKLSWLFLQNPNLATFEFWWIRSIPWRIMIKPWSNDYYHFKMLTLTKKFEVWLYIGHNWHLTLYNWFSSIWAVDWANFLCKAWNLTRMILGKWEGKFCGTTLSVGSFS